MKFAFTSLIVAASLGLSLAGCGKKEAPAETSATTAPTTPEVARVRQTEKFGFVNGVTLEPLLQAPASYGGYVHQQASEVDAAEYRQLPNPVFETYVDTWLRQAASTDKPDWDAIAAITHPAIADEENQFKKQAAADQAKGEIKPDKNALNVVFGWQGEILTINGPDVTTGEYYLAIQPDNRYSTVAWNNGHLYNANLFYKPRFDAVGMTGDNRGLMQLTVKVPIEKAREIESLREGGTTMIRVYGHVTGLAPSPRILRKDFSQAALDVEVEALEFGIRKNGQFKTFFFLDADQLKKSKA